MSTKAKIIIGSIILLCFLTILVLVTTSANNLVCKNIIIRIDTANNLQFVSKEDVLELLNNKEKFKAGMPVSELNMSDLEQTLANLPFIEKAEVYSNIDGDVIVDVVQRKPVLRVVNFWGESYYVDDKGKMMPLSPNFVYRTTLASGLIPEHFNAEFQIDTTSSDSLQKSSGLTQCYKLALYLEKNPFWKYQTAQIFVNHRKEIELVPRVGNHIILIGDADNLEKKFERLTHFYLVGLKDYNWNRYKIIDVQYENQIVCTKNEQTINKQ